jgi:hypothetical protein
MNTEGVGLSFAKVIRERSKEDKSKKKSETLISLEDDESRVRAPFHEWECMKGEKMQLIPIEQKERSVLYVCGQSGSGKSYYSNQYIRQYRKMYPKNNIYLFSPHEDDKSLSCKAILKIRLDENFLSTPLQLEDFKDSLCMFDDIDVLKNKSPIKMKLQLILQTLLETGRHANVSVIYISHLANKGFETKCILNEATSVVIFPKVMSARACGYLLGSYFGLTKQQISRVKNLKSRAVTLIKLYPNCVMYDGGVYILDNY